MRLLLVHASSLRLLASLLQYNRPSRNRPIASSKRLIHTVTMVDYINLPKTQNHVKRRFPILLRYATFPRILFAQTNSRSGLAEILDGRTSNNNTKIAVGFDMERDGPWEVLLHEPGKPLYDSKHQLVSSIEKIDFENSIAALIPDNNDWRGPWDNGGLARYRVAWKHACVTARHIMATTQVLTQ